jgi:hypothetical protein
MEMNDLNYPPVLFKYLDFKGAVKMLYYETLQFTPACELNDPYDCCELIIEGNISDDFKSQLEQECRKVLPYTGVCSLTSDPLNMLMWAHYGKGHTGLCLGINTKKVVDTLVRPHPNINRTVWIEQVKYQAKVPTINFDNVVPSSETTVEEDASSAQQEINNYLSTKLLSWEYEQEWRLLLRGKTDKPQTGTAPVNNLISCIYLGCRFPESEENAIYSLVQGRNIPIYHVKLSRDGNLTKTQYVLRHLLHNLPDSNA